MTELLRGTVVDFNDPVGLGHVQGADGSVLLFHCTQIADGTRTIPSGTHVTYRRVSRPKGDEAYEVKAFD